MYSSKTSVSEWRGCFVTGLNNSSTVQTHWLSMSIRERLRSINMLPYRSPFCSVIASRYRGRQTSLRRLSETGNQLLWVVNVQLIRSVWLSLDRNRFQILLRGELAAYPSKLEKTQNKLRNRCFLLDPSQFSQSSMFLWTLRKLYLRFRDF